MDAFILGYLKRAKAIAFDGCHKIYVLMDDEQVALMKSYGYEYILTSEERTPEEMLENLKDWYANSCGLRFIEAVRTDKVNPNAGFTTLVAQCEEWEDNE